MKPTKKQFNKFKEYCEHYLKVFDLDKRWDVLIKEDYKDDDALACVAERNIEGRVALINLCAGWDENNVLTDEKIKEVAKHEAIHILLADLVIIGKTRYITEKEINKAEEELVQILLKLLPDS